MIVDSSAIIAIVLNEPDWDVFVKAITRVPSSSISAANYLECGIRLDRESDPAIGAALDPLLTGMSIRVEAVTPSIAQQARIAYRTFGKGNHPARLNYGDCFAYALAKQTGEPLLFKGNDFSRTDIQAAI